jgi:hypothetical protein
LLDVHGGVAGGQPPPQHPRFTLNGVTSIIVIVLMASHLFL